MTKKELNYVVGFATQGMYVALIKKTHPDWQKGKLNGIGGHIELSESPHQTMVREFYEETAYKTNEDQWNLFLHAKSPEEDITDITINIYYFISQNNGIELKELISTTDEKIHILPTEYVICGRYKTIWNTPWILSMGLFDSTDYKTINIPNLPGDEK